ncbi:MAG: heavy metal translocating P-type ATPase [Nevskiaceae bacterium]|nr:MAG: heavy metal translocating P-type ATPase [Nevskiaceae bacterium]TBR73101.1 MAG: heavy metal translocating P-type ATPase [Nevskiaceae bacterium]
MTEPAPTPTFDPVCGMRVTPAPDTPQAEHAGQTYFFCGNGCRTKFTADPEAALAKARRRDVEKGLRDPVCGMRTDPDAAAAAAAHSFDHDGHRYHFCSAGCKDRFAADPARYLDPSDPRTAPPACATACDMAVDRGAIYTCPMHPEVRHVGPGDCPKCGMALDPLDPVTAGTDDDAASRALVHLWWLCAALTLPVFVIAMLPHAGLAWPAALHAPLGWAEAVLATIVTLWGGRSFFVRGWNGLRVKSPNMYTLVGLGAGVAWAYSAVAFLAPDLFPAAFRNAHGGVAVYFESAAVIITLVMLGDVLEHRARRRSSRAIAALLALAPKTAHRVRDGAETEVPIDTLQAGDLLRVRPGEKLPVDGVVVEGRSHVDESMLTGEPQPQVRQAGAAVSAGCINGNGVLLVQATRVGGATTLAQIVALVAQAQRSRAPAQRIADRVAAIFVPAVVACAGLAFISWALWGPAPNLAHALVAAISVLIIACPCALGLATPISIMVASGRGAQAGVLFRDAAAIEALREVDTLVVDKTGTLTTGRMTLSEIQPFNGFEARAALAHAAALEVGSEHPLARAIRDHAREQGLVPPTANTSQAVPGQGMAGTVEGRTVALGNTALMQAQGVDCSAAESPAAALRTRGATTSFLAVDGKLAALLAISDQVKPEAAATLRALKAAGLSVIMATGDAAATAQAVAAVLPLDGVEAELTPAGKAALVARLKAAGQRVAMAGDGINDAPALAAADVGIAMGTGTDVAIESATVTLVGGTLGGLVRARALSQATVHNIRQNLFFAFIYNGIGIPIAAGALYLAFGLMLSPMIAALAMSLSSVSVVTNALRLQRVKLDSGS